MINRILERLEKKKKEHLNDEEFCLKVGKTEASVFCSAKARAIDGAIQIVQEVAKEYGKDTNVHTNADRIRSMSDEELAVLIASISDHCLAGIGEVNCSNAPNCDGCKNITLKWLKKEVKE